MALSFDFYNSIILVPSPQVTLNVQTLIDEIRDVEDELTPAISYGKIADASGKDDLGGGVTTGITVRLLDNWRVKFEDRAGPDTITCTITGGNLVGGPSGNPVAPSAYTQVIRISSSAGTIATPTTSSENTNLKYLLSAMFDTNKAIGDIFYWDPINGSDTNTGLTPSAAVSTFAKAQTLTTAGNHDIVFALSTDPSGITTITENLNITTNTLKLKGPGYVFQLKPSTTSAPTIRINADSVEVSGLYLETALTGSQNGINITGDNNLIKDVWIANTRGHGINLATSTYNKITSSVIEHCGTSGTGNGINIGNDITQTQINKNIIFDSVNGISLSGTGIADNVIENNLIYGNSSYGVTIGSGVSTTTIRGANTFNNNTSGSTSDAGINTYIETTAGGASASEIADAVWNEVIAGHTNTGTAGKMLKDAKTKATLASLK